MSVRILRRSVLLLAVFALSLIALAGSPVKLELTSLKVVTRITDDGKKVEELVPAVEVKPGDVIEWKLRAENASEQTLHDVALVIPIPAKTYYLDGSASPLQVEEGGRKVTIEPQFSYDGGHSFGRPPLYKKVKERVNGKEVIKEVPVAPEEYTHARWVLQTMAPGQVVEVYLRTVVR